MIRHARFDPSRPAFIGLDLAWSRRNRSGGAVIQDGALIAATGVLGDDGEILEFVAAHLPAQAAVVAAVDAPLCVPNEEGCRRCDGDASRAWGKYEAGAYPGNRRRLADSSGGVRGEELSAALAQQYGFVQTAPLPQQGPGRYLCEVFPHPTHVALFGLERTLKYKHKQGRDRAHSAAEMVRYQHLLAGLALADPPLRGLEPLTSRDAAALRGQGCKELEDTLDAVTCAYFAYYAWWRGPGQQQVYGSIAEGHILTPRLPEPVMDRR